MLRLGFGDVFLIMQTVAAIVKPWNYRITYLQLTENVVVKQETGLSSDYILLTLSSSGVFAPYNGKTLLLEIYQNDGTVLETDTFLLSHSYTKLPNLQRSVKLLGENCLWESESDDFQDGYCLAREISIYPDATLTTPDETIDGSISYVTDFTPDHRYHLNKQLIKSR